MDGSECPPAAAGGLEILMQWLAQVAQAFEGVNAGVVAVVPDDLVRVVADRAHRHRPRRPGLQLLFRQNAKWVRRLGTVLAAGRARAVGSQFVPGDDALGPVIPLDVEAVLALAANHGGSYARSRLH